MTPTVGTPSPRGWRRTPIWQALPFVQNGKVHRLPDGIWMFGGPTSMEQYIDAVVNALTA